MAEQGAVWMLCASLLVYAVILALAVLFQGKLLFGSALRVKRAAPGPADGRRIVEPVLLAPAAGSRLQGWLTIPAGKRPERLLVWFGGRNEHVAWTRDLAGWLPDDCALLSFNYRSLGGSKGWPSETACVEDAEAIVEWGLGRLQLSPDALFLCGRSLGTGIAMQLSAKLTAAGRAPVSVALISPLMSMRAILARSRLLAPLVAFLRSPFDSMSAADALRCDVLVLLAARDRRVPHAHSLELVRALRAAGCSVSVERIPATDHCTVARAPLAMHSIGRWLSSNSSVSR